MSVLIITSHSEASGNHKENEDEVRVFSPPGDDTLTLCLLADGQGGRSGGKEAAQTAVHSALTQASGLPASRFRRRLVQNAWLPVLTGADEAVSENGSDGFTTLIGLAVWEGGLCGASCGDSGVLLVRNKGEAKWLTKNQRKNPPVGSGAAFPVGFRARFTLGDTLLIMSDGAFRYVGEPFLTDVCRAKSGSEIIAALREKQAGQRGLLSDDFSMIVVQI